MVKYFKYIVDGATIDSTLNQPSVLSKSNDFFSDQLRRRVTEKPHEYKTIYFPQITLSVTKYRSRAVVHTEPQTT